MKQNTNNQSEFILQTQGLVKEFKGFTAVDNVNLQVRRGHIHALIGPNGAQQTVQHTPRYVADDLLTLKFAALSGTGICWLPDYMCHDEIRDRRLVRVLPDWAPTPWQDS